LILLNLLYQNQANIS